MKNITVEISVIDANGNEQRETIDATVRRGPNGNDHIFRGHNTKFSDDFAMRETYGRDAIRYWVAPYRWTNKAGELVEAWVPCTPPEFQ